MFWRTILVSVNRDLDGVGVVLWSNVLHGVYLVSLRAAGLQRILPKQVG